jgi:hypothetical protein
MAHVTSADPAIRFVSKVQSDGIADNHYAQKTWDQVFELTKKQRETAKRKVAFFLNCKNRDFSRKVFFELAAYVNDCQMQNRRAVSRPNYDCDS